MSRPVLHHLQLALCLLLALCWAGSALSADKVAPSAALVQVQDGDMASVLAFRLKPRGATIEQMMVALLRHNPQAFIQGNVNLLLNGVVLRLPAPEEVLRIPPDEARSLVELHHSHFLTDPDKLVLPPLPAAHPAPLASSAQTEDASERGALLERLRTAKARLNEIQRNIEELERLTRESSEVAALQPPPAASEPVRATSGIPYSWIWLGVAAIVATMIGVGSARRSEPPVTATAPAAIPTHHDAAAQFQVRLGALDLNLDAPASGATTSSGRSR